MVADDVGDLEVRQAGLARAEKVARAAQAQVQLGDLEAVRRALHRLEALGRVRRSA